MRDFDWTALLEKRLEAPYKPSKETDNFDKAQANNEGGWKKDDETALEDNTLLLQSEEI